MEHGKAVWGSLVAAITERWTVPRSQLICIIKRRMVKYTRIGELVLGQLIALALPTAVVVKG